MQTIEHTYTIQWVGPFFSYDELKAYFSDEETISSSYFNFYYFEAQPDYRYNWTKYLGIHKKNDGIQKRLNTAHEHLSKYLDAKELRIWIGTFGSESDQKPENVDIVETLLIRSSRNELPENTDKKKSYPKESVSVINLWYDDKENHRYQNPEHPCFEDVIVYYAEDNTFLHGNLRRNSNANN